MVFRCISPWNRSPFNPVQLTPAVALGSPLKAAIVGRRLKLDSHPPLGLRFRRDPSREVLFVCCLWISVQSWVVSDLLMVVEIFMIFDDSFDIWRYLLVHLYPFIRTARTCGMGAWKVGPGTRRPQWLHHENPQWLLSFPLYLRCPRGVPRLF